MSLNFKKFTKKEKKILIDFLISEEWTFHKDNKLNKKILEKNIQEGFYTKKDQITFLMEKNGKIIGILRVFDLKNEEDEIPMFDLRIKSSERGKGFGKESIKFMIKYIFINYNKIRKIEGTTRNDNLSMRKLFEKSGFKKVAQFRKDWKDKKGKWHDTIGYDFLKKDFKKLK